MALRQGPTVQSLRAEAKAKGVVGYSKMKKAELLEAVAHPELHRVRKTPARKEGAGPTVKDLKAIAKQAGLKGYSGRKKSELEAILRAANVRF